ncbi:MAG: MATE family efflux transporter, partial [Clostridia bacterium]|nr:MATE family efflux transporter [Clostridia bacterium]
AAVAINAASLWLINGVMSGVGVGYSVQVANAIGAGDHERARAAIRQGLIAFIAVGLFGLALFEGLASLIPVWLGGKPEVIPLATQYLRYYALSFPVGASLYVLSAILRCTGDTKTPLLLNTTANLLNVVFNFFLIYDTRTVIFRGVALTIPGAGMGVAGAALASAIAITIAGLFMIRTMFRSTRPLAVSLRESFRPDRRIIGQAARLGLPYIGERMTVNLGQIAMTGVVAHIGTVALAANHIATTAEGLCYLPAYGISFAATALVGQAVGAKNREDARAYGTLAAKAGFLLCLVTGIALFLLARPLASIFTPDPEVIDQAALVLKIVSVSEPFFAVFIVLSGALRGAHDVRFPMFLCLGCMWGIRVVCAPILVFVFDVGLAGVWIAMAADLVLRGVLCMWRWRSGRWVKKAGLEESGSR